MLKKIKKYLKQIGVGALALACICMFVVRINYTDAARTAAPEWKKNSTGVSLTPRSSSVTRIGIGTTTPYTALSVVGEIVQSYFTATSTTATSTIAGDLNIDGTASTTRLLLPTNNDPTTPTVSFGDGDTGLYEVGDDTISWAFGGARIWTITSSKFASEITGGALLDRIASSATNPAHAFSADEDTGIGRAAADTLSLITAATERMRIDSSGNVGIGVTDPDEKLEVAGASHFGNRIDIYKGGNATKVANLGANDDIGLSGPASTDFVIKTTEATSGFHVSTSGDSTPNFSIIDSGNVGIGTTTPKGTFIVHSTSGVDDLVVNTTGSDPGVILKINDTNYAQFGAGGTTAYIQASNDKDLKLMDDSWNGIIVKDGGNVGIGTVSPESALTVQDEDAQTNAVQNVLNIWRSTTGTAATGLGAGIMFQLEDDADSLRGAGTIGSKWKSAANGSPQANLFFDDRAGTTIMTLEHGGNVGIGTTSPLSNFSIEGTAGESVFNVASSTGKSLFETISSGIHKLGSLIVSAIFTNTDGATITVDWKKANVQTIVIGATGRTLSFEGVEAGASLRLYVCQDGTGNRTITTYPGEIRWKDATAPTLSTGAHGCDIVVFSTATSSATIFGSYSTGY